MFIPSVSTSTGLEILQHADPQDVILSDTTYINTGFSGKFFQFGISAATVKNVKAALYLNSS